MKQEKLRVAGFPERLPTQQWIENKMKELITKEYQKYGYINIETPAVERNDVLTSKSWAEVSKQVFGLYGLAQWEKDIKEYSLHFDLTVPLARYIIDHEENLEFPFKRYQIQKVRRGERQQKWRFKEFYQCDVDVIDKNVDIAYDAEVIEVLYNTLKKMFVDFDIPNGLVVQMNNRKLFDVLFESIQVTDWKRADIMRLIDDYYKMDKDEFVRILEEISGEKHKKILEILSCGVDGVYGEGIDDEKIKEVFAEIKFVHDTLKEKGVNVIFDPYVVRWLDYYSWTVFETFIEGYEEFGSVCSGWRFDNLVNYIREKTGVPGQEYGWVGGSIWMSRLLNRLLDVWLIEAKEPLVDVIIFNLNDNAQKYRDEIAKLLRNDDFRVDQYFKKEKLAKQFKYAESKNIPRGIFAWEKEESENKVVIKDLNRKESIETDKESVSVMIKHKQKKID